MKKQRHYFTDKGLYSQSYGFSSSNVWMWELDHRESWALKNWCFWTAVLEKTLESPLDCKDIKSFIPKGNQPWIFITRTDAETEALILWPPDEKSQLTGKVLEAGKNEGRRRRGWQWMRWLDGKNDSMDLSLNKLREMKIRKPSVLQSMGSQRVRQDWGTELNWCRESIGRCIFCSSEIKWHLISSSLFH